MQVRTHFIHMPVFIDLLQPLMEEIDAECILMFLSAFKTLLFDMYSSAEIF